jgi:dihydrodipicolinate synthase/N-acetylneuraminate lyase
MTSTEDAPTRFSAARRAVVDRLFPDGIPALWCPSLTHFTEGGALDRPRMRAHLRSMFPHVRGFMLPGSTGEGWELSDAEALELVVFMAEEIGALGGHLLVGALRPTAAETVRNMEETLARLRGGAGGSPATAARSAFCGFTVCPPTGAELSQDRLRSDLERVLSLGAPTSLYQLPQVTKNELSAETVAALAARHPSFYLLKDTSGEDRIARTGFRDVFLVRGAEGDYARHLAGNGGRYDGFLLSTANCFAAPLARMIEDVRAGRTAEAEAFSARLTALVEDLFARAGRVGYGNPFTNANKAVDHFFAHGPDAARLPPPLLRSGRRLPVDLVEAAGAALRLHRLMPERGYLGGG